jgi:hypothetical protein
MDSSNVLKIFNEHFSEFLDDVQNVFPSNTDISTAKFALLSIRKLNPSMIIKIWKSYISDKYQEEIISGDISFFIDKDYNNDFVDVDGSTSNTILQKINILRAPIKEMGKENQDKAMKYIQNLTKLSNMYNK